jgi:hypothetical protein
MRESCLTWVSHFGHNVTAWNDQSRMCISASKRGKKRFFCWILWPNPGTLNFHENRSKKQDAQSLHPKHGKMSKFGIHIQYPKKKTLYGRKKNINMISYYPKAIVSGNARCPRMTHENHHWENRSISLSHGGKKKTVLLLIGNRNKCLTTRGLTRYSSQ